MHRVTLVLECGRNKDRGYYQSLLPCSDHTRNVVCYYTTITTTTTINLVAEWFAVILFTVVVVGLLPPCCCIITIAGLCNILEIYFV